MIKTGYNELDKLLELNKGNLMTIASKTKNENTKFVLNIGTYVAKQGTTVAIFNLKSEINKTLKHIYLYSIVDLDKIKEKSIELLLRNDLGLIIIDDIELIKSNEKNLWQELYKMAKELDIPILVTTKVNIPKRKDDKLYLADLGDILTYARQILFLYNEENRLIVNVARNTNGNTGVIKL